MSQKKRAKGRQTGAEAPMRRLLSTAIGVGCLVMVTTSAFAEVVVFQAGGAVPKFTPTGLVTCTISDAKMELPVEFSLLAARTVKVWDWLASVSDPPFIVDFSITLDGSVVNPFGADWIEKLKVAKTLGYQGRKAPTGYYKGEVTLQPGNMASAIAQCEQRISEYLKGTTGLVIGDRDVLRVARAIVKMYGGSAVGEATNRADEFHSKGETQGAAMWYRVADEIKRLSAQ